MSAQKAFYLFMFEMLATYFFVAFSCGGLVGKNPQEDSAAFGLQFGLVGMVIVHIFGFLSGALLNPSVVLASIITGALSITRAIIYLLAEFAGAFLGYYTLIGILGKGQVTDASPPLCLAEAADLSDAQIVGVEFLITTVLIFGLTALLDSRNRADVMPLRAGVILAVCILGGVSHTGTGLNSAIMVAAATANENFEKLPLYLAGQFSAAIFAPLIWKFLMTPKC